MRRHTFNRKPYNERDFTPSKDHTVTAAYLMQNLQINNTGPNIESTIAHTHSLRKKRIG